MTWGPLLWDMAFSVGWAGFALFLMLWIEERKWSARCFAEYMRWKEWAGIIGRHANEMWAALSRQKIPKEPPCLSETPTLAMPRDELRGRLTGMMPRFKMTGDK